MIFGHDKFAYEMVHFVAATADKALGDGSMFSQWEDTFMRGLESLLVECAVIHDDIERDCFISRVYCWFTEKLMERREVPRNDIVQMRELTSSVGRMGSEGAHTTRALQAYAPEHSPDHRARLLAADPQQRQHDGEVTLPPIQMAATGPIAARLPLYVKHSQPAVLRGRELADSFTLPKLPGAEENYGLLYSQPETEAEKNMNELWLARRRQEAFEYKTQQQLAIVMDRLALHKSRLESDALRRQESSNALKARPRSASPQRPHSQGVGGSSSGQRPRGISSRLRDDDSPASSPERPGRGGGHQGVSRGSRVGLEDSTPVVVTGTGTGTETQIAHAHRSSVLKSSKKDMKEVRPMRFKIDLPEGYSADRQRYYMQLSDSDDDDRPDRGKQQAPRVSQSAGGASGKKKPATAGGRTEVFFQREHPAVRERPQSARQLHAVAVNDPEFKVHYRHTNYRRMPLTAEQEAWLEAKETERSRKSEALAKQMVADVAAKADKKKNKDKDKGGAKKDDKDKDKKKKDKKATKSIASTDTAKTTASKYKSASQFMSTHFPQFEHEDDAETMGPMRTLQLLEVSDILGSCERYQVNIREGALRKALVVPQDKPEAVCLEGLRDGPEGLMTNPMPPELWRKFTAPKKGGGKKKKGKK